MSIATPTARTPLGASTLNRKYWLDVREVGASAWIGVHGIQELKNKPSVATTQDDSDFDGKGYKSQTTTALEHGVELKLARKSRGDASTAYDPGQELLRAAAKRMGAAGRIEFRIYEMEPNGPRVESEQGYASVTWDPDGGGMDATDSVTVNLNGQGQRVDVPHPESGTVTAVVTSAAPTGAAAGAIVTIRGAYFTGTTGATGVKFGAVNATSYTVIDDGTIAAVVPAGTAGSAPITVRNSAAFPYTRGA